MIEQGDAQINKKADQDAPIAEQGKMGMDNIMLVITRGCYANDDGCRS